MKNALLYRNRYRIPSARLKGWSYDRGGRYCVTICTQFRVCCLGEVTGGMVLLSDAGQIVAEEWVKTARLRSYVELDEWIVMPNHFHGILTLKAERLESRVPSLGAIIGNFKGSCTERIRAIGHRDFAWQPRFFDQIIPDEATLLRFRRYILENPRRWERDRYHPSSESGQSAGRPASKME